MGLADRYYMREGPRRGYWSATITLLITNVAVFFLQKPILFRLIPARYLELSLDGIRSGFVWQLITFQFLHVGLMHLLFNSLALYFFGRMVEMEIGRSRFLQVYFLSGVVGGLVQMLFALGLPYYFNNPVVGASAGLSGLIGVFALMHWHERFTLFFYFFPLNITGKILFWVSAVLSFIGILNPGPVAEAAHLGGLLAGAGWVMLGWHRDYVQLPWEGWFSGRQWQRSRKEPPIKKGPGLRIEPEPEEEMSDSFISREVDPILDKISQHGIQSLTEQERKVLEKARSKMAKR